MAFAISLAKLLLASTLALSSSSTAAAIQPRDADIFAWEPRAATGSTLANFCAEFKATCSDVCLNGKTGSTEIVFACVKNSDGTLGLGCRCDGTDTTRIALAQAAQPDPTTTRVITKTKTTTSKSTSTSTKLLTTRKGTTTLRPTKTTTVVADGEGATLVITVSSVVTPIVSSGTLSLSSADTIYTRTPYVYATSTIYTTTSTSYSIAGTSTFSTLSLAANNDRRAVEHAVLSASIDKRDKVSTTFCDAYSSACTANCKVADSSVNSASCTKDSSSSTADNYSVKCTCKDGSSPSLHALQDVVTGGTTTQSTTRTRTRSSTVFAQTTLTQTTARSTVTRPTTKTEQSLNQATSTITTTIFSTAPTVTVPETTTVDTGTPDGYGGNEIVRTASSTRTYLSYATLTVAVSASTTLNILAPTGRVRADKSDGMGGTKSGYMATSNDFWFPASQPNFGIPYGLVLLPPDGTGVDSYYLANMRTIGSVVANAVSALSQWTDESRTRCSGLFAFDTKNIGGFNIKQPFRLGASEANTVNLDRVFEVPLLPHLITNAGKVIAPPVYQLSTGASLAWGTEADCQDPTVAINHLYFEPLS